MSSVLQKLAEWLQKSSSFLQGYWFAYAGFAVKFNCVLLVPQGLLHPYLASEFRHVS